MPITTNNHIRDFIDISEVPNSEKDDWNCECHLWVKYKGMYIALVDFGYSPDGSYGLTNTASIVIRTNCGDGNQYIIGIAT